MCHKLKLKLKKTAIAVRRQSTAVTRQSVASKWGGGNQNETGLDKKRKLVSDASGQVTGGSPRSLFPLVSIAIAIAAPRTKRRANYQVQITR